VDLAVVSWTALSDVDGTIAPEGRQYVPLRVPSSLCKEAASPYGVLWIGIGMERTTIQCREYCRRLNSAFKNCVLGQLACRTSSVAFKCWGELVLGVIYFNQGVQVIRAVWLMYLISNFVPNRRILWLFVHFCGRFW